MLDWIGQTNEIFKECAMGRYRIEDASSIQLSLQDIYHNYKGDSIIGFSNYHHLWWLFISENRAIILFEGMKIFYLASFI